jgi:hypothetical protein
LLYSLLTYLRTPYLKNFLVPAAISLALFASALLAAVTISSIAPPGIPVGSGATPITIAGQNFAAGSSLVWTTPDGQRFGISANLVRAAQMAATIPASLLSTAGTAQVAVSDFNGVLSNQLPFKIYPFLINSVTPGSVAAGSGATQISIAGQNFTAGSTLAFTTPNGPTTFIAPSLLQASQLAATVPSALLSSAGTAQVAVANAAGATSNQLAFSIFPFLVSSVTPGSAFAGSGATQITVGGQNFTAGSSLAFTTPNGPTYLIEPSLLQAAQLSATIPAVLLSSAGTAQVAVANASGIASNQTPFSIAPLPTPTADSVTPSGGLGTRQVFTAVYSDAAGYGFINRASLLINSSLSGAGACFIQVDTTGIYLSNDANSALSGPLSVSGALSNSQCTVNSSGSGTSNSGNSSTLTLSITFKAAFAGAKNIYMSADDTHGGSSGWQLRGTFTVAAPPGLYFVPITPCRALDTRVTLHPFNGGESRIIIPSTGPCGIPFNAQAYSMNIAVVPEGPLGYLTVWPTGQAQPLVATLNSDGRVKSSAAIVPAGTFGGIGPGGGAISVFATNATDVVIDVDGYFVPANAGPAGLQFYPLAPCRLVDTRSANGPLAGPSLAGQATRVFPFTGACGIPSTAHAYSVNLAAIPLEGGLSYLTAWPTGQTQPFVSTLNAPIPFPTANAAIVAAGTGGSISIYATQRADLVIDVNGYFAPPGSPGALSLYTGAPCRVLDSRMPAGSLPFSGSINVNVLLAGCDVQATAQAFVFNATVVPPSGLGYLTLWPQGTTQPFVATLNASDASITNNMAIVPATNGSISAFASNPTHLVLDLFGYFAP